MKLHKNQELFEEVINVVAVNLQIDQALVEKDYYVSLILKELASIKDIDIVFKGGTSLSKCFNVIDRFSEDIDLAVLYDGDQIGNSKKEKLKREIISTIDRLKLNLLNEIDILSRRSFNKYEVKYPKKFYKSAIIADHIIIETITAYKPYPTAKKQVNNLIFTYLSKNNEIEIITKYDLAPFEILTQTIERTFIDKIFAICDYHVQQNYERHSRHIYDLSKIWASKKIDLKIVREILDNVINDRQKNNRKNYSCQRGARPMNLLKEIILNDVYKTDYNEVTLGITYDKLTYELAKKHIIEIIESDIIPKIIK